MASAEALRDTDKDGPVIPGGWFLSYLFVVPERWGEGIGGALLDAVLAEAKRRGYSRMHLWTHDDNERSHRLYRSRGFSSTGRTAGGEGEWVAPMRGALGPCDDQPMAKTVLIVDDHAPLPGVGPGPAAAGGVRGRGRGGGNGGRGRAGCHAFGPRAAPGPCPAGPTVGAYRGCAMRLRLGRARLLGGLVGARQPGQG